MSRNKNTRDLDWNSHLKKAAKIEKRPAPPARPDKAPAIYYPGNRNRVTHFAGIAFLSLLGVSFTAAVGKVGFDYFSRDTTCDAVEASVADKSEADPTFVKAASSVEFPAKVPGEPNVLDVISYRLQTNTGTRTVDGNCSLVVVVETIVDETKFSQTALDGSAVTPANFTTGYLFDIFNNEKAADPASNYTLCNNQLEIFTNTVGLEGNSRLFLGPDISPVDSNAPELLFVDPRGNELACEMPGND